MTVFRGSGSRRLRFVVSNISHEMLQQIFSRTRAFSLLTVPCLPGRKWNLQRMQPIVGQTASLAAEAESPSQAGAPDQQNSSSISTKVAALEAAFRQQQAEVQEHRRNASMQAARLIPISADAPPRRGAALRLQRTSSFARLRGVHRRPPSSITLPEGPTGLCERSTTVRTQADPAQDPFGPPLEYRQNARGS